MVLPTVNTDTLQIFLDRFAQTLPEDVHALMVLDGAGWHAARALAVSPNITLVPPPPYSPQSNPIGRVWLSLRERFLYLRILEGYSAIIDACRIAGNAIADDANGTRSLRLYRHIQKVIG